MAETNSFTTFGDERPNYFAGQYLLEDDFQLQHKYLSDRQRYHNQSLHISGIIEGLEVIQNNQNKKEVEIKPGSAIDPQGNLIILKENITFFDFNNTNEGILYIKFQQEAKNKQPNNNDIPDSHTRWKEQPILGFATQVPENSVNLAKIILNQNSITLDATVREYSGVSLPNPNTKTLTLRSGGNANPNLAVLTGSLKIDGDLNIDGGNINLKSTQKIVFKDTDTNEVTQNKLKIQLWDGYGFGINPSTLFYTSHLYHSWRDSQHNERMLLTTNADGGLTVKGTGTSSFNGNVGIGTTDTGSYKLNVQGHQLLKGNLTIDGGQFQLNGLTDSDGDKWPIISWGIDVSKSWEEGLLRHSPSRGYFNKAGYGIHFHRSRQFGLWSTGFDSLFSVEGQTGNTYIKGNLTVTGTGTSSFNGNLTVTGTGTSSFNGNLKVTGTIYAGGNPIAYENYEIYLTGTALLEENQPLTAPFLKIANIPISMRNVRGLNTVILSPNGTSKTTVNHDVFERPDAWNTWADWLESNASDGDVIAVASYDALRNAPTGGAAERLLRSINAFKAFQIYSTNTPKVKDYRSPYTLLFIKGKSRCLEEWQPDQNNITHLKTTYYQLLTPQNILRQEEWQTPTFQNGWVNCDKAYNPAGYFKDSLGIVHLRGLVKHGTVNGGTIFILPVGYRPSYTEIFAVLTYTTVSGTNNNGLGRVDILTDGTVKVNFGNNGWISLDGITFRAA